MPTIGPTGAIPSLRSEAADPGYRPVMHRPVAPSGRGAAGRGAWQCWPSVWSRSPSVPGWACATTPWRGGALRRRWVSCSWPAGWSARGWATFRLLAALRRRWWPLALALLLVATYLSLWTLGQAVAASYAPRPDLGSRTPADLELAYRDVTLPSSDGVDLAGWYVPTRNGAAVALLHGAGSTRSAVLDEAAVLTGTATASCSSDARGHGESAGRGAWTSAGTARPTCPAPSTS